MPITTYGGTFRTDKYGVLPNGRGVEIRLWFNPEELVVCPKIGMTQTINAQRNGAQSAVRPEVVGRSNTAADGDPGRYLDRAAERTNPLYGTDNAAPDAQHLGGAGNLQGQDPAGNAQALSDFGHRNRRPDGTFDVKDAMIYDTPARNWQPGDTGFHTFETTAMCLEGDMAGVYLGSVTWGYDVANGVVTPRPLALATMGVPTSQFMAAANKWNAAQVSVGGVATDTMDLPTTDHATVDPATLSDRQLEQRMRELHEQLHRLNPRDDQTTYRNVQFEIRGLGREAVRRGSSVRDSGHKLRITAGMTLWDLAARHLGGGANWVKIFALNAVELQNGDRILAGGELKMPEPYRPGGGA